MGTIAYPFAAAILAVLLSLGQRHSSPGRSVWPMLTALGVGPLLPVVLRFYEFPRAIGAAPWPALRIAWVLSPLLLLSLLAVGWSLSPRQRPWFALLAPAGGFLILFLIRHLVLQYELESGARPDDMLLWMLCGAAGAISTLGLWLGSRGVGCRG